MQTTLRIDDQLYREAKAEAAREGVTLTRFLEEGLRMRLAKKGPSSLPPHPFRLFKGSARPLFVDGEIRQIAKEEDESFDASKWD